ncbi:MAG: peptidylprolyl isomerase, partial [Oscillospiraceae bacterium]
PEEEVAVIQTNKGVIKVRLFPKEAPKAVENFKTHAKEGYYDGLNFHRVIPGFMIQGGDPEGTGAGGKSIWGEPFEDEFDIKLRNFRGALSMANSGPKTNGSQFFIVQAPTVDQQSLLNSVMSAASNKSLWSNNIVDKYNEVGGTPHLDYLHTVFGQVYEGMDVVDAIAKLGDEQGVPSEDVIIEKITIVQAKDSAAAPEAAKEPVKDSTTVPEAAKEPAKDSTAAPEAAKEPAKDSTTAPEAAKEPAKDSTAK